MHNYMLFVDSSINLFVSGKGEFARGHCGYIPSSDNGAVLAIGRR